MMFSVLSPAKKLDFSRAGFGVRCALPALMEEAAVLIEILRGLHQEEIRQLMGVSQAIASLTHARFQELEVPFSEENAGAAILAFDGDAYKGLDAGTLSGADLEWAQDHLAILSGLFGVLRPLDLIQPYRLEIGTRLKTDRGSNLYQFWGDRITIRVNQMLESSNDPVLINLASGEYFKGIKPKILKARIITPVFHEVKSGEEGRIISFSAKFARGLMARYIVQNRIDDPEALKDFNVERYAFQAGLSSDDTWIFSREFMPK